LHFKDPSIRFLYPLYAAQDASDPSMHWVTDRETRRVSFGAWGLMTTFLPFSGSLIPLPLCVYTHCVCGWRSGGQSWTLISSLFRWCRPHIYNMKLVPEWEQQDSAGSRGSLTISQLKVTSPPVPLPVAVGRAQPKDRAGSKKHKQLTQAITLAPSIGLEKHTSCSASALGVICVWERRDKSIEHGWTEDEQRPSAETRGITTIQSAPSEGRIWTQWDWGPYQHFLAPSLRPQLVASFTSITLPQTPRKDETSGATRIQRDIWDFLDWLQCRRSVQHRRELGGGLLFSIGWQRYHLLLYVFNVYTMMLLSEGTETS